MTIAREYRRLSDAGGSSLNRQGSENAIAAAENDWTLGDPYVDDGKSASKFARTKRDDFELLTADVASGAFGADVLMLWESSRGSRRVGEWVMFIELCEDKGIRIWVTTHGRLYDPANGRDRKALIEDAVDSEYESYKTHRRTLGTAAFEASRGRPHGVAPDGLQPVYDAKGKLETWVEDPTRSAVPKLVFEMLESGHTLGAIERKVHKAGHLNLSGRPFSREHLRYMATKHAYAGLRSYKGTVYQGVWDGLVSEERFWNVQVILNANAARVAAGQPMVRNGRATHDLTDTLRCGPCTGPLMVVTSRHSTDPTYRCRPKGCVQIDKRDVDELIIGSDIDENGEPTEPRLGALLAYLARDDIYELLAAPDRDDETVASLRADLAEARANRSAMEMATAETVHEARVLARSAAALAERIETMEALERELTLPPAVAGMIRPGVSIWTSWMSAPVSARREVARTILKPEYLGQVRISAAPNRGPRRVPAAERIEWHRAAAGARLTVAE